MAASGSSGRCGYCGARTTVWGLGIKRNRCPRCRSLTRHGESRIQAKRAEAARRRANQAPSVQWRRGEGHG